MTPPAIAPVCDVGVRVDDPVSLAATVSEVVVLVVLLPVKTKPWEEVPIAVTVATEERVVIIAELAMGVRVEEPVSLAETPGEVLVMLVVLLPVKTEPCGEVSVTVTVATVEEMDVTVEEMDVLVAELATLSGLSEAGALHHQIWR